MRQTATTQVVRRTPRPAAERCCRLARFGAAEDGSVAIFGIMMFVLMIMLSGMAVDIMRYEAERTKIQNTLDAATLAAANLDQTLDPESVVDDYFNKAGLSKYLGSVQVDEGLNYRTVTADASTEIPTFFMKMMGINSLPLPAHGQAEERIGQVEISLVLDVSGSMASNSKIQNLKVAAKQFIDTMFNSVEPGKLSISIVPYAAQVTAGATLLNYYNYSRDHAYSYCIDFSSADFNSAVLSTTTALSQTGHFDPWYRAKPPSLMVCPPSSARTILPFSGDKAALKAKIDGLQAEGNTSIDVGMKWGAALLDPSARSIVSSMIANGTAPASFEGRPFDYSDHEALKVIVVMTDGENTTRNVLNSPYNRGNSIVYKNSGTSRNNAGQSGDGDYSIYDASRDQYWVRSTSTWRDTPWGNGVELTNCYTSKRKTYCTETQDPGYPDGAQRMTWPQVWNDMSIDWFAYYMIYKAYNSSSAYNSWWAALTGSVSSTTMDNQLGSICTAAKGAGDIVYSIGFETSSHGASVLKSCASSPAHFFNVQGLDITTAFAAIASSINHLRLTE